MKNLSAQHAFLFILEISCRFHIFQLPDAAEMPLYSRLMQHLLRRLNEIFSTGHVVLATDGDSSLIIPAASAILF